MKHIKIIFLILFIIIVQALTTYAFNEFWDIGFDSREPKEQIQILKKHVQNLYIENKKLDAEIFKLKTETEYLKSEIHRLEYKTM